MPEIPGVQAKISADVSTYLRALVDCAGATKQLGDVSGLTKDEIIKLIAAQDAEAGKLLQLVDATEHWTDAQQRQAMAISAAHDQALRYNEVLDEGKQHGEAFAEELLKMVGLGAAVGGGMELAAKGFELVKEATVGGIESFVEFGHGIDLVHEKLNVPLEVAAAWEQSASVTGMSAERITSSLAMMDTRLATANKQAIDGANDLGLSLTELRDATPDKQVEMLAEAMERFKDSGGKADVVIKELMGRGGLGMLPVLTEQAQALAHSIEEGNGPLEHQVETAKHYEEVSAKLSAHWASIRRTMAEPAVGWLATLGEVLDGGAYPADWIDHPGGPPKKRWGADNPVATGNVVATQADLDRSDRAGAAETERIAREKLRIEMAMDAAQRKTDAEEAKAWAAAEGLATQAAMATMTPLEASIQKIEDKRNKEVDEAYAAIAAAQASDTLTQGLLDAENARIREANAARDAAIAKAEDAQATKDETEETRRQAEAANIAATVDGILAKASEDDARAHHRKGDAIDFATEKAIAHIHQLRDAIDASKKLTDEEKRLFDALLDEAEGHERSAGAAKKHHEELKKVAVALQGASQVVGEFMGLLDEFGDKTTPAFRREMEGLGKAVGGLGEVAQGYASGNYAQAIIGVIHMAEGIHRMLVAPETEKIMNDVGLQWGVHISEGLAKAIESTEMKDHVNRQMAELLNLDAIMGEQGGDPDRFWYHINDLMQAVALGAVPAREGLDQLGKAWQTLRTDAEAGSVASEAAMVAMIKRAQELGENIPGMKQYLLSTLQGGAGSLEAFFGGQGAQGGKRPAEWGQGLAGANETILGATFGALSGQEGVIKAAEDLQKAFDELMKHVPPGVPLDASLQHMQVIEELLQHEDFKKAAEASAAGGDTLKALLDTGNLNQRTTDAFATATKSLLQQSIKAATDAGYDPEEARVAGEEANLPLLTQLQHAQELGTKLDPDSEAMLAQAQKDGILPLKTVAEQQLDELRGINRNTGGGGAGGGGRGNGGEGHGAPEEPRGEGGSGRGEGGAVRSFGLGGNVNRTAPTFEYSTNRGHAAAAGDGGGAGGPVHVTFGPIHVNGANAAEIAKGLQEEIRRSGASGLVAEVQRKLIQSYGR